MKIAIVGSGISGLVTAYLLHQEHEIVLFESNDYAGGHTNTIQVESQESKQSVDTGFIVFNENHYPNFTKLLKKLDVSYQPTTMSFSVRCERTGLEYNVTSLNTLFAQRRNLIRPSFWHLLWNILRFNREAPRILDSDDELTTVRDYLNQNGYSQSFQDLFLTPMGAALWSCPQGRFHEFPIRFVVQFMQNHRMLQSFRQPQWSVIKGGSYRYVEALTQSFRNRIRLNTPVNTVTRSGEKVHLAFGSGEQESFDQVILACHADQALNILTDATECERQILSSFPYQKNEAVLHNDRSVLPRNRRAWASWNYHLPLNDPGQSTVTYYMNMLQNLQSRDIFNVTLNETASIDSSLVIRKIDYEHPVYTKDHARAQKRHPELIGNNRTSFCGAYWGYGFHEDGVNSALAVCRHLGVGL